MNNNIKDLERGTPEFKKGCQPRTNLRKAEKGNLFADSPNILSMWKNYFCGLLNEQRIMLGRLNTYS
jgi:hypothetical protein